MNPDQMRGADNKLVTITKAVIGRFIGIMGFIVNFETIEGSLMRPKWPILASLAHEKYTLVSVL